MANKKGKANFSKKASGKIQKQKDFKIRRKEFKNHLQNGGKSTSVKIKNLPFSVKVGEIKEHFEKFGDICDVKLMTKKGGKLTGNGFVHFNSVDSADTAIKQCSGEDFMGRKLHVEWAMPLRNDTKPVIKNEKESTSEKNKVNKRKNVKEVHVSEDLMASVEDDSEDDEKVYVDTNGHEAIKINKQSSTNNPLEGQCAATKKGRIIVRNLSFKTTEEKLMDHFRKFGAISEVKLLKKEDGKLVGCGFVQFEKKLSAIQAIQERNSKPFLGRPIICDWALPKDKYLKHIESEMNEEEKKEALNVIKIKEEPESDDSDNEAPIKMETEVNSDSEEEEENYDDEDEDDNDYDEEEDEIDELDNSENEDKHQSYQRHTKPVEAGHLRENKKPKVISNDVTNGCTIFIKNIPFSATNDDLKKCMKQFGPLEYALVCVDKLTEHSKGTGFVKFKKKEDAEACLQGSGELMIDDQVVEVLRAIPRDDIQSMDDKKNQKQVKDKRHLYLVKEGVIMAGSPAARDVSVSDMEKRLKIEQWKTQMLRNLNMFVSNTRLIIYNVPPTWTDAQVRELFKKHAGPGAIIKEARIMKDMRNVDANGVGKSKEFAFVHFTEPKHALQALRNINNNPNIFTKGKRPIISFSIENKAIHKIKEKRLQKSRQAVAEKQNQSNVCRFGKKGDNKYKGQSHNHNLKHVRPEKETEVEVELNAYSGLEGKPGNKKMRTKFKLKTQASVHQRNVKESKRKQKLDKNAQKRNTKHKEPQAKRKKVEEDDSFSKLVDKYKAQLMSSDYQKRWYE